MRVLLVEKDRMIIKTIVKSLLSKDCEVVSIQDGYDAIKTAKEKPFDAIIANIFLTELSGLEFIAKLTENDIKRPIYVISKTPDENFELQAHQLGTINFIAVPFEPVLLVGRVIRECKKQIQKKKSVDE